MRSLKGRVSCIAAVTALTQRATRPWVTHRCSTGPLQILFTQTDRATRTSHDTFRVVPRAPQHVNTTPLHPTTTTMTTTIQPRLPMTNISVCDGNKLTIVTGPCILVKTSTVAQQVQAIRPLKQIKPNQQPEALRCKRRSDFQKLGYTLPKAQPATVHRRNARERNRVKLVNLGFETLREHVPSGKVNKKLSKVETLRSAVEYIRELQNVLNSYDQQSPQSPMEVGSGYDQSPTDSDVIGGSPSTSDTSSLCSSEHDHNDNMLNSYVDGNSVLSAEDYNTFPGDENTSVNDQDYKSFPHGVNTSVIGEDYKTFSSDVICSQTREDFKMFPTDNVNSAVLNQPQMSVSDSSSPTSVSSDSSYDSLGSIDDKDILCFSRWLTQLYSTAVHESLTDTVSHAHTESLQTQLS